jgi:hypothetical protein
LNKSSAINSFERNKKYYILGNNESENSRNESKFYKISDRMRRSKSENFSSIPVQHSYVIDKKVYLELMVVIDKSMEEYYSTNLENHIMTLLFLVYFFIFFYLCLF